jgi:acyl-CoA reductase-like NAD-dependent aldehyde dehydrogenase
MYVAGAWVESESGSRIEAASPATGETIGSVPEGTRDDARRAIAAANAAAREWAGRSAFERAAGKPVLLEMGGNGPLVVLDNADTKDLRRGLRFAEAARAGWVNVNESTNYWESHLPFGGRSGSQSGIGRVGGRFSMETFTELKTVVVNLG